MTRKQIGLTGLCWAGWLLSTAALAQKTKDMERRYRAGVRSVQLGDYDRARAELQPVLQQGGSFAPFAYYYSASASFRQKRYEATRTTLKELIDRHPNWHKKEEAYFLAASAAFEQGLYDEGLSYTQLITGDILRVEADRMKRVFLPRISDLNRLKGLQKQYPNDKTLARTVIDLIQRTSSEKDDLELSDRLSNRFGIAPTPRPAPVSRPEETAVAVPVARPGSVRRSGGTTADRNRAKGYYNVGVLLPFRISRFNVADRLRNNQYVYDLYEGMKLAKTKLMAEGITVNLFAYDVENDADQTLDLLNNPSFAQNDLLIGPLFAEPNRLVVAFADQNNIPLVNPISTSRDLILNHANAYLAQPSTTQQAIEAARFAKERIASRRAAVYFGATRKDSLLAQAYQTELKTQGFRVIDFRRLTGNATTMAAAMNLPGPDPGRGGTADDNKPGHVFFATSNNDDGPRMLDALSRRSVASPLITTYPAFNYFRNSLSTFTRRELYLLAPEFMDATRPATETFQETYLAKRNTIPSNSAASGYDMLLFFGRQLAKSLPLRTDDPADYVLSGFDYTQSNDNQIVPIIQYDGGRFVRIN